MKLRRWMIVATVVVTFAAMYSTGAPRPTEPGMIAYTPTRVEWLALQLEADYRDENFENVGQYSIGFAPKFPNTIMILVNYTGAASAANVDTAIDVARILVKKEASNYGWSDWVKVEVQRKVLPTNH